MAKLVIPARAGQGSASFPTKTVSIPQHRFPKLQATNNGTSAPPPTEGQIWPRRT